MERHKELHTNEPLWSSLRVGQNLTVVKLDPEGNEAARYSGVIGARLEEDDWVAIRATWTYQRVDIDGLVVEPGDELIEWFSPIQPFNAFGVISPGGVLRGWYANVTYPAYLESAPQDERDVTLFWHDLYLDVIGLPNAAYVVRDEDELAESMLETRDEPLHREIVAAKDELGRRFLAADLPFQLLATAPALSLNHPAVPE